MPKKTLITGGAGTIGYFLSKTLSEQGQGVVIVDNLSRGKLDKEMITLLDKPNVSFIKADVTNLSELEQLLPQDCDYVYHLAAINGTKNFYERPVDVLRVGVLGTFNMLDWFKNNKKGKILLSSSNEAYASWIKLTGGPLPTPEIVPLCIDDPSNLRWSYAGGKLIGEIAFFDYAHTYNFPMVIIRYHNSYGPRMGLDHVIPEFFVRAVKKEDPFKIFGDKETRSFCYIDDSIRATQLCMESEKTNKQIVHIGNDQEEISMIDLANKIFDLLDWHPKIEIQPAPKGCVPRRCPDISKIKKLTGYKPSVDLEEGLKRTWQWYKDKI